MAPPSSRRPQQSQGGRNNQGRHSRHISSDALLPKDEPLEERPRRQSRRSESATPSDTVTTSNPLSADSLAKLNALNEKLVFYPEDGPPPDPKPHEETRQRERNDERDEERRQRRERRRREEKERGQGVDRDQTRDNDRYRERERRRDRDRDSPRDREERRNSYGIRGDQDRRQEHRKERRDRREEQEYNRRRDGRDHNHYREKTNHREKRRVISGPQLEQGEDYHYREDRTRLRVGKDSVDSDDRVRRRKKKRNWIIAIVVSVIILIIIIAAAVSASKHKSTGSGDSSDDNGKPSNGNLRGISPDSIPTWAQGTYLDPFTWYDTQNFNVTFTNATVGGLPLMGLNSTWNNNVRANPTVPPLTEAWKYGGDQKIHGINLGGWLSLEPFITPSLFNAFSTADGVIDEWTLTTKLGPSQAAQTLEQHYSSFVSFQTFSDMRAAGFDHVRIPFSYWAVTTYDGDPYVPKISFRYLLRAIEYARQNGLRINLDLHGAPGSQNGWNHSGRQGPIGWLNGTDGSLNAQRTIDIHKQLGAFFGQDRYTNLVTMYGLVNEPRMTSLSTADVVTWSQQAISALHSAGLSTDVIIIIGDGFLGLANWADSPLSGANMLLDAHQYVIFNSQQIILTHTNKINFACNGWTQQSQQSMSTSTGFGSFLCGEWSQADTDCQTYLNNVGVGSRWEGTLNVGNDTLDVLIPTCPLSPSGQGSQCQCASAMADPSAYSDAYKQWLLMFAEAQMHSYEVGWGWFYWTWKTETATQWSYEMGMQAGILPTDVRNRDFDCTQTIPDFGAMGLSESY